MELSLATPNFQIAFQIRSKEGRLIRILLWMPFWSLQAALGRNCHHIRGFTCIASPNGDAVGSN
jgi:hypothetical protein